MGVFNKEEENLKVDNKSAETLIGSSVKVEGSFVGKADVLVEGEIIGNVKTKGNLTVAEGAKIQADVEATNLLISGEIIGNIKCHGKIELTPSAKITGDIETQIISVQTGAIMKGCCSANPETKEEGDKEKVLDKKKKK